MATETRLVATTYHHLNDYPSGHIWLAYYITWPTPAVGATSVRVSYALRVYTTDNFQDGYNYVMGGVGDGTFEYSNKSIDMDPKTNGQWHSASDSKFTYSGYYKYLTPTLSYTQQLYDIRSATPVYYWADWVELQQVVGDALTLNSNLTAYFEIPATDPYAQPTSIYGVGFDFSSNNTLSLGISGGSGWSIASAQVKLYADRNHTVAEGAVTGFPVTKTTGIANGSTWMTVPLTYTERGQILDYWDGITADTDENLHEITSIGVIVTTSCPTLSDKVHSEVFITPDTLANYYSISSFTATRVNIGPTASDVSLSATVVGSASSPFYQYGRFPAESTLVKFYRGTSLVSGTVVETVSGTSATYTLTDTVDLSNAATQPFTAKLYTTPNHVETWTNNSRSSTVLGLNSLISIRRAENISGTDYTDRIGINTGSPLATLDVNGSIKGTSLNVTNTSTLSHLDVTGTSDLYDVNVTTNLDVSGNLDVNGTFDLAGTFTSRDSMTPVTFVPDDSGINYGNGYYITTSSTAEPLWYWRGMRIPGHNYVFVNFTGYAASGGSGGYVYLYVGATQKLNLWVAQGTYPNKIARFDISSVGDYGFFEIITKALSVSGGQRTGMAPNYAYMTSNGSLISYDYAYTY